MSWKKIFLKGFEYLILGLVYYFIYTHVSVEWFSSTLEKFLNGIDEYAHLLLTNWPAVVLVIFLILSLRHKNSLDKFLERVKSVSPTGFEAYPAAQEQSLTASTLIELVRQVEAERNRVQQDEARKRLFERIYGAIFGSQILILQLLKANPTGISFDQIRQIYSNAVTQYPMLSSYQFEKYLNFLKVTGLATVPDDQSQPVTIAPDGEAFLEYIQAENLSQVKLF